MALPQQERQGSQGNLRHGEDGQGGHPQSAGESEAGAREQRGDQPVCSALLLVNHPTVKNVTCSLLTCAVYVVTLKTSTKCLYIFVISLTLKHQLGKV